MSPTFKGKGAKKVYLNLAYQINAFGPLKRERINEE